MRAPLAVEVVPGATFTDSGIHGRAIPGEMPVRRQDGIRSEAVLFGVACGLPLGEGTAVEESRGALIGELTASSAVKIKIEIRVRHTREG